MRIENNFLQNDLELNSLQQKVRTKIDEDHKAHLGPSYMRSSGFTMHTDSAAKVGMNREK